MQTVIEPGQPSDASIIADLAGELLHEIMAAIGDAVFGFDAAATARRARAWMEDGRSLMWLARNASGEVLGFVTVYEGHALYAEGAFGTISELFVRPAYRSQGVGAALLQAVRNCAISRRWTRMEVTTPPLPQFERALAFYERHGFAISGGRKMKVTV